MKAQIISILATYAVAAIGTFIILKVISAFTRVRATVDEEMTGLDLTMHGEEAYRDLVMSASLSRSQFREKTADSPSVPVN